MKSILIILVAGMLAFSCKEKPTEPPDETPPTVSILYPADNAEILQGTQVNIKVDANDKSGIKQVDFLIDGNNVHTAYSAPYSYDWDTATLTGKHTIKSQSIR